MVGESPTITGALVFVLPKDRCHGPLPLDTRDQLPVA